MDDKLTLDLFRAKQTVYEMLIDRGYKILEPDVFDQTVYITFVESLGQDGYVSVLTVIDQIHPIQTHVWLATNKDHIPKPKVTKTTKKPAQELLDSQHHIYVMPIQNPSKYNPPYEGSEVFDYKELVVNKTKHSLVPKHIKLNEEQRKEVISRYSGEGKDLKTLLMFKRISVTDPIMKYYNAHVGDLYIIYANSPPRADYRLVVAN